MRRSSRISTAKAAATAKAEAPLSSQQPTPPKEQTVPAAPSTKTATSVALPPPPPAPAPLVPSPPVVAGPLTLSEAAATFIPGEAHISAAPNPTLVNPSPSKNPVEVQPSPPPSPKKKYVPPKRKDHAWKDLTRGKGASIMSLNMDVFDRIFNLDADLCLRDHLALASTCRWIRSCYTDQVWHVLLQSLEKIALTTAPSVTIGYKYLPNPTTGLFSSAEEARWKKEANQRSFARWIFTTDRTEAERSVGWGVKTEDWVAAGNEVVPASPSKTGEPPAARDPWASQWRDAAVRFVNGIKITQTDATKLFSVSKSDLLALKFTPVAYRAPNGARMTAHHYIKSAVDALALRARGGPAGLKAHLEKNESRKRKAAETRANNPKPRAPSKKKARSSYYGNDYNSWEGEEEEYGSGVYPHDFDPYEADY